MKSAAVLLIVAVTAQAAVTGDAYEDALARASALRAQLLAAQAQPAHQLADCTRARLTREWFAELGALRPLSTPTEIRDIDKQQTELARLNAVYVASCEAAKALR